MPSSAHSASSIFIVFISSIFLGAALSARLPCPPCGSMAVPYPLSTHLHCGHPNYPITCTPATQSTQPQLHLQTLYFSYPILTVNPTNRTLLLAPPPFLGSSCLREDSASYRNITLNASQPYTITDRNTLMLFNCSSSLRLFPLNCSTTNPCNKLLESRAENCNNTLCCSFNTWNTKIFMKYVPMSGLDTAYMSVVDLDVGTPVADWTYGLEVGWDSPMEPPCEYQTDCGASSTCRRAAGTDTSFCQCNRGHHWDSFTGTCPEVPYCVWRGGNFSCHKAAYAAGILCGIIAILIVCFILVLVYRRLHTEERARVKLVRERELILCANRGGRIARLFSAQEMKRATNGYARNNVLGCGGFGEVFKGILEDGTVVAIKVAKIGNVKGTEQVLNEVRILAQLNHRSLVRLLGCCVETEQPVMVSEFVMNGNLFDHLNGSKGCILDWKTRLRIALQAAEGLAYLHSSAYATIYHRDVKSNNILLDEFLNAKVADFGLSRLAEPDLTHVSSCVQGSPGYLDPEYYRNYHLSDKSDVYSFGVVLLELVTSQKAIDFSRGEEEVNLATYVQLKVAAGKMGEVVDPKIAASGSMESIEAMVLLALDCLKENRRDRPIMKEVVEQLQRIISREGT